MIAGCAAGATAPARTPNSPGEPLTAVSSVAPSGAPTTIATPSSAMPSSAEPRALTPSSVAPAAALDVLADISMTSVPPDVIVPTTEASLDKVTNPINGRRGGRHPLPAGLDCATDMPRTCLTDTLDSLGFDVTQRVERRAGAQASAGDGGRPARRRAPANRRARRCAAPVPRPGRRSHGGGAGGRRTPDRHLSAGAADHGRALRQRAQDGPCRRSDPRRRGGRTPGPAAGACRCHCPEGSRCGSSRP